MNMTSRERLLAVLHGEIPDACPVAPFVQEDYLSYYYGINDPSRLYDAVRLRQELDFDLVARMHTSEIPFFLQKSYLNWEVESRLHHTDSAFIRDTTIKTPLKIFTMQEGASYDPNHLSGLHFTTMKYFVEDERDLEIFKKYMPTRDKENIDALMESGRIAKAEIGDLGISCPWGMGGVYNFTANFVNVQDMMVDALADEDYYQDYMQFFTELVYQDTELLLDSDYDCIGLQGNIANGSVMGAEYFMEHVLPYEKQITDLIREGGKPSVYHNCGKAKNLYPAYPHLGITVWETISEAPQGDNVLKEAKEYFGDQLILFGNLDQVHFLKTASPEEVWNRAYDTMMTGKQGGHYIFACSDYLERGTPIENVKAMIAGARAASQY